MIDPNAGWMGATQSRLKSGCVGCIVALLVAAGCGAVALLHIGIIALVGLVGLIASIGAAAGYVLTSGVGLADLRAMFRGRKDRQ